MTITKLDTDAVLAADDRRLEAMAACDLKALSNTLSEDLLYTHSSGTVDTKDSYLAKIRSGAVRYERGMRSEVLAFHAHDVVWLQGKLNISISREGGLLVLNARFLSVWVREAGHWRMRAYIHTPITKNVGHN
jgi:ketosteroid isomerase-like protein